MHGGNGRSGRPVIHGRYAKVLREDLRAQYEAELENATDLTDAREELAFMRTLCAEYQGRFVEGVPQPAEDVGRMIAWLSEVTRAVNRVSLVESRTALTSRQVQFLEAAIVGLISEFVPLDRRAAFGARLVEVVGLGTVRLLE